MHDYEADKVSWSKVHLKIKTGPKGAQAPYFYQLCNAMQFSLVRLLVQPLSRFCGPNKKPMCPCEINFGPGDKSPKHNESEKLDHGLSYSKSEP